MPNHRISDRIRPLTSASLALFAAACSGEVIDLGENASSLETPAQSCPAPGPTFARNQADIDALEGCAVIDGDLFITPFADADLRPLASLREVRGSFEIGFLDFGSVDTTDPDGFTKLFAFLDDRWLRSLEGLESLARAGSFSIAGFEVGSLEPLSNLEALPGAGSLQFISCSGFRDLSGLENLAELRSVETNCDDLESLRGLSLPSVLDSVLLSAPRLSDLGDSAVFALDLLLLTNTALENLDGLETLQTINALQITENPLLVDLDGLDNLISAEFIEISVNSALERLPEFEALTRLDSFTVTANPRLRNFPTFPAFLPDRLALTEFIELSRRDLLTYIPDVIEIVNNPALEQVTLSDGWVAAGLVTIQGNTALDSIAFADVGAIDFLSIDGNTALDSITLGGLATVDELVVSNNPALDLAVFDAVGTFRRELSSGPIDGL